MSLAFISSRLYTLLIFATPPVRTMPCFGCTPFSWVAALQSLVAQSSIFLCVSPERDVIPWSWRQYPFPDRRLPPGRPAA